MADNLQHIRGCSLPLQRFLRFVEQPRVLNCDHRLIGEGVQQGNLFVAERVHLEATQRDRSDAFALAQQWNAENRAVALLGECLAGLRELIAFGGEQIVYMHWHSVDNRAPGHPIPINRRILHTYWNGCLVRAVTKVVTVPKEHDGIIGVAKLAGILDDSLENRFDVGRRTGDDLQDLGQRVLLRSQFVDLALKFTDDLLGIGCRFVWYRGHSFSLFMPWGTKIPQKAGPPFCTLLYSESRCAVRRSKFVHFCRKWVKSCPQAALSTSQLLPQHRTIGERGGMSVSCQQET